MIKIRSISKNELPELQHLGKTTFLQAFGEANDPQDMQEYLDKHFSIAHLKKELENKDSHFFFAESDGKIIGYLKLNKGAAQTDHKLQNALEVERIYVLPEFQGKRVGQQLFNKALEVANGFGINTIWLGVWEKNTKAIRFYERNGFKIFDKHSFLLGKDLQEDLMMKLDLPEIQIRQLNLDHAPAFQALKLFGLQESPFSFSDSYEDENNKSKNDFLKEFEQFMEHEERFILGAFDQKNELKGYVIFKRDARSNSRHKAMIHNMYTHPDVRGKRVGKALMQMVLDRAKRMPDLEQIHLWVLHADTSASGFYAKLGFERQGPYVKKDQKILGRWVDAEYMVLYFK